MGPDTLTAAMTCRGRPYGGGDRRDACLALGDRLAPATTPYGRERDRGEVGAREPALDPLRLFPGEQDLCGRAGAHRELRPDRDGVAETGRALRGGCAHADVTLPR